MEIVNDNHVVAYVICVSSWRSVPRGDGTFYDELTGYAPVYITFSKKQANIDVERNNMRQDGLRWLAEPVPVRGSLNLGQSLGAMAEGWMEEHKDG